MLLEMWKTIFLGWLHILSGKPENTPVSFLWTVCISLILNILWLSVDCERISWQVKPV